MPTLALDHKNITETKYRWIGINEFLKVGFVYSERLQADNVSLGQLRGDNRTSHGTCPRSAEVYYKHIQRQPVPLRRWL